MAKDSYIDNLSKEVTKEINMVKNWIGKRLGMKMRKKLMKVYDAIFDQFYEYIPTSYRRHDVEQRKPEGINLYRAIDTDLARQAEKRFISPHIIDGGISIDTKDMKDYNYRQDKEVVLKYVLDGIRFPAIETSDFYRPAMEFIAHYEDNECNATGTPMEVLNSVRDQLMNKYYLEAKEEAKKELKLKYVNLS